MAHEEALFVANNLKEQLSRLARTVIMALSDKKVSTWESMQIGLQGSNTALAIMATIQQAPPEVQQDMLFVLEHGQFMLPDGV